MKTHREAFPEQYAHPRVGEKVEVLHKDEVVARGTIVRVTESRFGQMAKLDTDPDTAFRRLSDCVRQS